MPMIKCPDCGSSVSDRLSSCPTCGAPIEKRSDRYSQFYQKPQTFQLEPQYDEPVERPRQKSSSKSTALSISAILISFMACITSFMAIAIASSKPKEVVVEKEVPVYQESDIEEPEPIPVPDTEPVNKVIEDEKAADKDSVDAEIEKEEEQEKIENDEKDITINKEEFISTCEEIPYKSLARNPDEYKGSHIKLTVKVLQVVQGGFFDSNEYYRVSTNGEYGFYDGDEYFMYDETDKSIKILQDDVLTVYAECNGTETVKRAFTNTKEDVVSIKAMYIELLEDYDKNEYSESSQSENESEYDGMSIGQKNALKSAKSYLDYSAYSYSGLIKQLEFEKYSHEDAVFAADNCGADWNEQAVKSAKSYLEYSSFSKDELIKQLEFGGFTHDQAVYGAEQNGY